MSGPALAAQGLGFAYGERPILEGVGFEVGRGELFGIIGPNGAGKSTLMSLCTGLLAPGRGTLEILGRPLSGWSRRDLARQVALVPQDAGAPFSFTVEQMVLMGRTPHLGLLAIEGPADLEVAREAMRATGVEALSDRPVDRLSGGERQRVLIARALAQAPRVLFCDEPTAHLDIRHQVSVYDLLWERTRQDGLTVVTVLHDLNLAAAYCDRLLLLEGGRPAAVGTVEEVLTYRQVKAAYGTEVWVGVNELTGARYLVPVAGHRRGAGG